MTEGELPHITGSVWNMAVQDDVNGPTVSGVFSTPHRIEGVGYATEGKSNANDGFDMNFGQNQPHNNLSPIYAVYRFKRVS